MISIENEFSQVPLKMVVFGRVGDDDGGGSGRHIRTHFWSRSVLTTTLRLWPHTAQTMSTILLFVLLTVQPSLTNSSPASSTSSLLAPLPTATPTTTNYPPSSPLPSLPASAASSSYSVFANNSTNDQALNVSTVPPSSTVNGGIVQTVRHIVDTSTQTLLVGTKINATNNVNSKSTGTTVDLPNAHITSTVFQQSNANTITITNNIVSHPSTSNTSTSSSFSSSSSTSQTITKDNKANVSLNPNKSDLIAHLNCEVSVCPVSECLTVCVYTRQSYRGGHSKVKEYLKKQKP